MADIHPPPGPGMQMPQAPGAGPAPVPYAGPDLLGQPFYSADMGPLGEPSGEVMNGIALGGVVSESAVAHSLAPAAVSGDAPYYPGPVSPIAGPGDGDADDADDVRGSVQAAVDAATARWQMNERDTYQQGSVIGDLMTLPPNPLDPGVGSLGTTDPAGAFYDPPRNYRGGP